MNRPDSAQVLCTIGTLAGYLGAHYDRIAATACALVGIGYTIWKWRNDARAKAAAVPAKE